jgi:hypothetical protein
MSTGELLASLVRVVISLVASQISLNWPCIGGDNPGNYPGYTSIMTILVESYALSTGYATVYLIADTAKSGLLVMFLYAINAQINVRDQLVSQQRIFESPLTGFWCYSHR